jgi:hypothetical protein
MYKHLTHTRAGLVTLYGLQKGFIQSHPTPTSKLYLTIELDQFYICGVTNEGKVINKPVQTKSICKARVILNSYS